jgi:hypothetical protein
MKATAKIQILTIAAGMMMGSVAFGNCPGTADVAKEMRQFGAEMAEKIDGKASDGTKLKEEDSFHKLNINASSDPRIKALDGIGIVTKDQSVVLGTPVGGKIVYGSAFAISKCHVLVSYHTLNAQNKEKGLSEAQVGQKFWTHLGQGNSCSGNAAFKTSRQGTVQDSGGMADEQDWAVIKLDSPASEITPLPFNFTKPKERSVIMRVGHPGEESLKDNSFINLYGQFTEVSRYGAGDDGMMYVHDTAKKFGTSGNPAINVLSDRIEAIGITVGTDTFGNGLILPMKSVFKQMKKSTRDSIVKAIKQGVCE